jgi:hypothetical protein
VRGDPLAKRVKHWTRWRTRQLQDSWRHGARLDLLSSPARAAWLCSWQRSGSTWLAEVLASAPGTRLIYEPANLPDHLVTGEAAATEPLDVGPGAASASVEAALHGRVRGAWVDQLAVGHLPRRRIVKDVRAIGFVDVVAARQPLVPIIVLLRHPLSVASSVVELGWTPLPDAPRDDQLLGEVHRWISLHDTGLRAPVSSRALVVTYEHLVSEPDAVLDLIVAHLAAAHPTWRALEQLDRSRLATPSATSFRRSGERDASAWIGDFDALPRTVVEETAKALGGSLLASVYGGRPEPLVGVNELAASLAAR